MTRRAVAELMVLLRQANMGRAGMGRKCVSRKTRRTEARFEGRPTRPSRPSTTGRRTQRTATSCWKRGVGGREALPRARGLGAELRGSKAVWDIWHWSSSVRAIHISHPMWKSAPGLPIALFFVCHAARFMFGVVALSRESATCAARRDNLFSDKSACVRTKCAEDLGRAA